MIRVLNDPLPETLIMEKVLAWQQSGLGHILKANHTRVIMMFLYFL